MVLLLETYFIIYEEERKVGKRIKWLECVRGGNPISCIRPLVIDRRRWYIFENYLFVSYAFILRNIRISVWI